MDKNHLDRKTDRSIHLLGYIEIDTYSYMLALARAVLSCANVAAGVGQAARCRTARDGPGHAALAAAA